MHKTTKITEVHYMMLFIQIFSKDFQRKRPVMKGFSRHKQQQDFRLGIDVVEACTIT